MKFQILISLCVIVVCAHVRVVDPETLTTTTNTYLKPLLNRENNSNPWLVSTPEPEELPTLAQVIEYPNCIQICYDNYATSPCNDSTGRIVPSPVKDCSLRYCESQNVTHYYEWRRPNGSILLELHHNYIERTYVGQVATMRDSCLYENGLEVTLQCFGQSVWQLLPPALKCRKLPPKQLELYQSIQQLNKDVQLKKQRMNETESKRNVMTQLRSLLHKPQRQLLPADLITTEQILRKITIEQEDAAIGSDLISVFSGLMQSDRQVLRISAELNTTNSLLYQFEDYMDALPQHFVPQEKCGTSNLCRCTTKTDAEVEHVDYADVGVHAEITSKLSVFFVNPKCSSITGIAIYSNAGAERLKSSSGFWFRFVKINEQVEKLKLEQNLEVAAFLPAELWTAVHAKGNDFLVFKVYAHDALFVDNAVELRRRPSSKVLSISIPGFTGALPSPVPFLLANENHRNPFSNGTELDSGCGYWNYCTWVNDGVATKNYTHMLYDPVISCYANHLTSFTYLVGGSFSQQLLRDIKLVIAVPIHERVLNYITLVGCCLSLLGLLGIWLTAALLKNWRQLASTKILLNFCLALTFQLLTYGLVDADFSIQFRHFELCIIKGALLQYSVLVVFSWMLVIARLQFQRYVTVIGVQQPKHYIIRAAFVAWLLPLLPTLSVVLLQPESYQPNDEQLLANAAVCYPSGNGLTYGVVLPIALITLVNMIIVFCIFQSVWHAQHENRKKTFQRLRLFVLLFFLLGLSWIFGLLSYMHYGLIFSYLFCITATLQGFVLFVYFVALKQGPRKYWLSLLLGLRYLDRSSTKSSNAQSLSLSSSQTKQNSIRSR